MSKPKNKLTGNPWESLAPASKERHQVPKPERAPRTNASKPSPAGRVNAAEQEEEFLRRTGFEATRFEYDWLIGGLPGEQGLREHRVIPAGGLL